MVYDDGSTVEIECADEGDLDEQEARTYMGPPTDDEIALGGFLGAMIDIDDDESDGSEWAGVTAEELQAMAEAQR